MRTCDIIAKYSHEISKLFLYQISVKELLLFIFLKKYLTKTDGWFIILVIYDIIRLLKYYYTKLK